VLQEIALPPRKQGGEDDAHDPHARGEEHSPIGLSRQGSSNELWEKEALARKADAFVLPPVSDSSTAAATGTHDAGLNAD
jgi:hypothetical protein